MSAFIVSNKHIEALVTSGGPRPLQYHFNGEWHPISYNEQKAGQILLNENIRSVETRYNSTEIPTTFILTELTNNYTAIEIVKLCDSLDYQSCETDDWLTTEAYAILQAIRENAIRALPGYVEAPWVI